MRASGQLFVNILPGDALEDTDELGAQSVFNGIIILVDDLGGRRHRRGKADFPHRGHEGDDLDPVR